MIWLTIKQPECEGDPATSRCVYDVDVHINVAQITSLIDCAVWEGGSTPIFGKSTRILLSDGRKYYVDEGIASLKARMIGAQ